MQIKNYRACESGCRRLEIDASSSIWCSEYKSLLSTEEGEGTKGKEGGIIDGMYGHSLIL